MPKQEPEVKSRQQRRHEERKLGRCGEPPAKPITSTELKQRTGADIRDPSDPAIWGGKLNIYTCERCHAHVVTRDVHEGVTPFQLSSAQHCPNRCGAEPRERVYMQSSFYRVWDQRMREDYQWYRPAEGEPVEEVLRDHVSRGGLIIRPNPKEPS